MADNSLRTPGAGETIASDDIGGVKYQRVKLTIGADGVATDVGSPADALSVGQILPAGAMFYNGAAADMARANTEQTLLASAPRTATTDTATVTNHNARGAILYLYASAIGTGTLQLVVIERTPGSLGYGLAQFAASTTPNGAYMIYPGASSVNVSSDVKGVSPIVLPRSFMVRVAKSDSSEWTYQLTLALIL